jgi:hypothetical protein
VPAAVAFEAAVAVGEMAAVALEAFEAIVAVGSNP